MASWLVGILVVGCIAVVVVLSGAWVLAYWATHPIRIPPPDQMPADIQPGRSVEFAAPDGVWLSGWFLPRPNARATIVLCHGHQFNRMQMIGAVRILAGEQYQFLLFDFRRSGRSGGSVSTVGYLERGDVTAAVNWLEQQPEAEGRPIGVFGVSMGGAAAILAAAEDRRIAAVATLGAYATLDRAVMQRCRFFVGSLAPLLATPTRRFGEKWLPGGASEVAPVGSIGRIAPRPVLLMHGRHDPFVNVEEARLLYAAASEPRRLVILPHSWHITIAQADEQAYASELRAFFRENLK